MIHKDRVSEVTNSIAYIQQLLEHEGFDSLSAVLAEVREHLWETLAPETNICKEA